MSDWTRKYTDAQHRHALGDMIRDMRTVVVTPCPKCGEPMDYLPPTTEGDPCVIGGMNDIPGGWYCESCENFVQDEEDSDA